MIFYIFVLSFSLLFGDILGLKHYEQHAVSQSASNQEKLTKIKQLLTLIQDPDINSLLKINSQTLSAQKSPILQNSFTQQEIQTIAKTKQSITQWKQCPSKSPYYDGLNCVSCKKQEVFDLVTQKCARCISGTIYDKKKNTCVSRSSKVNIALTQMDLPRAQQIIIIRANRIAANLMSFVHEKTEALKYRLQFEEYVENVTSLTPNATNPHFLNLVLLSDGQSVSDFQLKRGDIPCPKQQPFYAINKCINCNYPTHLFDATTNWCIKCSNNFIYSVKSHKCIKLQSPKV